jgi:hypothetical protein
VRAGEAAEVVLVLDHVSPATVAVGAAAVVLAAVLLHEWLDDLDLPDPPAPPAWAVEAAFWIALDVVQASRGWQPGSPVPQVTSHFPRAGQVVEPGEVRVIFVLSGSIDPSLLPADAVTVETDEGFELPGATSWDAERWWLVWEPDEALPAGARLHVTLHARELAESTGLELAGATGFAFETAPAPGQRA